MKEFHYDFSKKIALVTGAGRGIGASLSIELCKRGAIVVGVARSATGLQETERIAGKNFISMPTDISDVQQIKSLFQNLESKRLIPSIVINNAGAIAAKIVEEISMDDYDMMMKVNVRATFLISQEIFRRAKDETSILNVSSIAGVMGLEKYPGFSVYTAAKSAVVGMTEAMPVEGRARKIWVNVVCPGAVDTRMLRQALPNMKTDKKPEDVVGPFLAVIEKSFLESLTGRVEVLGND